MADRQKHSSGDTENDRIGQNSFYSLFCQISCCLLFLIRFHKKQNDHSQNIIKRDISNQHQRSHIGFSVNITDKCDSQQCRITSKRRLSKLSTDILILHQSGTQDTYQSAANRDSRTEADKFSVPQCLKVCTPEIFQQQQRQRRPEDKSVDFLYKTFIQQSDLTKSISQKHCKKDRQRGI